MVDAGNIAEADAIVSGRKSHGRNWLVGRRGKMSEKNPTDPAPTYSYVQELTAKIRQELEADLEAKVNRKVKENVSWVLKKLCEANPNLNLNVGDFSVTTSDEDDIGTPSTYE